MQTYPRNCCGKTFQNRKTFNQHRRYKHKEEYQSKQKIALEKRKESAKVKLETDKNEEMEKQKEQRKQDTLKVVKKMVSRSKQGDDTDLAQQFDQVIFTVYSVRFHFIISNCIHRTTTQNL